MVEVRLTEGQDGVMARKFRSLSAEATEELGRRLGEQLWAGAVLTLDGDLGAGKTTFVRGLAEGLGIEDGVASPTYTLMQQHDGGRLPLFHFDAWMEGREKALLADGADEFFGHEGVSVVEWAGRIEAWLPSPRLAIQLRHDTPETRWISLRREGGEPNSGAGASPGVASSADAQAGTGRAAVPEQGLASAAAPGATGRIDALLRGLESSPELVEGGPPGVLSKEAEPGPGPGVEGL